MIKRKFMSFWILHPGFSSCLKWLNSFVHSVNIQLKDLERAKDQGACDSALWSLNRTLSQALALGMYLVVSSATTVTNSHREQVCQAPDWELMIKEVSQVHSLPPVSSLHCGLRLQNFSWPKKYDWRPTFFLLYFFILFCIHYSF